MTNRSQTAAPVGTAVVAGGSAGLGLKIAETLLRARYQVSILGRDETRLAAALAVLQPVAEQAGTQIDAVVTDVTDTTSVESCFAQLSQRWSRLDVLVNCVGQSDRGRVESLTVDHFDRMLGVNVRSALLCSIAALPMLRRSRGVVVNIGSLASKLGSRYLGGYCAAKHALAGLTQQMRLEWSQYGVHVGLVSPGPIRRDDAGRRYDTTGQGLPESATLPAGGAKLSGLEPQRVADAVLRCIVNRQPDLILPARVRLLVVICQLFPRLGDRLLIKFTGGTAAVD